MKSLPSLPERSSHTVGQAFSLLLVPSGSVVAFGPAWAVLCGACAATSSLWREARTLGGSPALQAFQAVRGSVIALVLTLFITEVLWSTWRTLLLDADRTSRRSPCPCPQAAIESAPKLPFTTPWSPLGRLHRLWNRARYRLRQSASVEATSTLPTLTILVPLVLLLSALAGQAIVLLSLAALCLAFIEWRITRHGTPYPVMQASMHIGLSWLAGHSAIRQVTIPSLILACCYAISYQGVLSMDVETSPPEADRRPWSLVLFFGGQAAAVVLLTLLSHPFMAILVSMLLAPQMLLLSWLRQGASNTWFLCRAVPFLMAAMPLVAWMVQQ